MRRRALLLLLVVGAAAVVLAGCTDAGLPDPVTEQGEQTRDLWRVFVVIAACIGALVYGLVIYVVLRYRRRGAEERPPDQRQVIVSLEALYTAIPLAIVGVLLGLSVWTERDVTDLVEDPDVTLRVVGFQWQWQFTYVDEGVTLTGTPGETPPELVLPVDATVRLDLESADVVHSFWVPKFLTKMDLIPGVENSIDVRVTEAGTWPGVCSEFCGLEHWRMTFTVRAVPGDEFSAWIDEQVGQ